MKILNIRIYFTLLLSLFILGQSLSQTINNTVLKVAIAGGIVIDDLSRLVYCSSSGNASNKYNLEFDYSGFEPVESNIELKLYKSDGDIFSHNLESQFSASSGKGIFSNIKFPTVSSIDYYYLKIVYNSPSIDVKHNVNFLLEIYPEDMNLEIVGDNQSWFCNDITIKATNKYEDLTYIWKKDNAEISTGRGLSELSVTESGEYLYELKTDGATNICSSNQKRIFKVDTVYFDLIEKNGGQSEGCFQDSAVLNVVNISVGNSITGESEIINESDYHKYFKFKWYKTGVSTADTNSYITVYEKVIYAVSLEMKECPSVTLTKQFDMKNLIYTDIVGSNTICDENPTSILKIKTSDNQNVEYQWYEGALPILSETSESINVETKGIYKLQLVNNICGVTYFSNEIEVFDFEDVKDEIVFSREDENIELELSETLEISVEGSDSIEVSKDNSNYQSANNSFTISQGGIYEVKAYKGNCYVLKIYNVVEEDNTYLRKTIPNVFSPSISPWILPSAVLNKEDVEIVVINRFGNIVYRKNNYNNDWYGTDMDGKSLGKGVYFYFIMDKDKEVINGSISIL